MLLESSTPSDPDRFALTRWSLVVKAAQNDNDDSARAMALLCQTYWPPLYAFIRRYGRSPEDAEDLTQEFFARLLEKNYLAAADPARGKFRTFLLTALKRFMANEWDKANCQKRNSGQPVISLDTLEAEERNLAEFTDHESPDRAFDRRWALVLLDQVLNRLSAEFRADGKEAAFEVLKTTLTAGKGAISHREAGRLLGISEGAARVASHRIRTRYRELLREELGETVANAADFEQEIRVLFEALS